jgi:hypothetical protein
MKTYVLVYDAAVILLYIVMLVLTMLGYSVTSSNLDILLTFSNIIMLGLVNVVFIGGDR